MIEPVVDKKLALEHGLSEQEWERILDLMGRTPTFQSSGSSR